MVDFLLQRSIRSLKALDGRLLHSYLRPEKVLLLGQAEYRVVEHGKGADAQQDARVLQRDRQRYVD